MDRMDLNTGFTTRCAAERTNLLTDTDVGIAEHDGKVCPGTNLKIGDDVQLFGSTVVRVLGGKVDQPDQFYAAYMDWTVSNSFTVGPWPCGDINTQYVTDRAPADPNDTDPIYVEPPPPEQP